MLRLETKSEKPIEISDPSNTLLKIAVYGNKIRETLAHFPTGHYMSLVSAYSPISIFDQIGTFYIKDVTDNIILFNHDTSVPFRNRVDLLARCNNDHIGISLTEHNQFMFYLKQYKNHIVELHLSATTAWCFGFERTKYIFPRNCKAGETCHVQGFYSNPPVFLNYLQVICRNVCGTSDSNMTMPTCLGIMHITNDFTLTNPHIAVNHRINEGRIIDIEILDQDNHPFQWAPVYLELFVSEKAEHEKRQGFFRLEKPGLVHLHAPVKLISVPKLFFRFPVFSFDFDPQASFAIKILDPNQTSIISPFNDPYFLSLRGKAITKASMINIFKYLNNAFLNKLEFNGPPPLPLIKAYFENDELVIETKADAFVFSHSLFITLGIDDGGHFTATPTSTRRINIQSHLWYNNDSRINLYCKEYHERYPIAVARRLGDCFEVINRAFWTWHELEKVSNELHFRAELVIVHQDGSVHTQAFPENWGPLLIYQLFYK